MTANSTVAFEQHIARVRDHALLASAAWLVVIPMGTLLPRYIRTFTTARLVYPLRVSVGIDIDYQPGGGWPTPS